MKGELLGLAQDFALSAVRAVYLYNADHRIISTFRRAVTPKHHYPTDIYSDPQYNAETVRDYIMADTTLMKKCIADPDLSVCGEEKTGERGCSPV